MRRVNHLPTLIRLGLLVSSFLTMFFIPKEAIKKYFPVATFSSILVIVLSLFNISFKWWKVEGRLPNKIFNDLSFILGPYFCGTIWIFHLTFGKFIKYFLTNLVMDALLSFPAVTLFRKLKIFKLVGFKPKNIFYITFSYALVLYVFQLFKSRLKTSK
ncbi:hypothetical protein [Bacillus sp. EB600]|uniref:hypothetical protein n=1 Tax=Bacillus sp. EB600 TaxID=2806345 RepID=UPI002108DBE2|nr:hypothetical protein [Bacillus sp. EB600]MCQ6281919.1 hypothetical protein [Bacillus sp. EB600]